MSGWLKSGIWQKGLLAISINQIQGSKYFFICLFWSKFQKMGRILEGNNWIEWDGGKLIRTPIWKGPHLPPYQSFNSLKKSDALNKKRFTRAIAKLHVLTLAAKNESRLCHLSCLEGQQQIQSSLGGMLSEPWVVVVASASGLTQIASLKPNWTSIKEGQKVPIHLKNVFLGIWNFAIPSSDLANVTPSEVRTYQIVSAESEGIGFFWSFLVR